MFINSLDRKPKFTRESDGVEIKDLTASMFNLNSLTTVTYNVYRVPRDYEMRPDLISAAVYNNSGYAEMILKYNGISNPFSIKEGDMILIPNLDAALANVAPEKGTDTDGSKIIRNSYKYIDPTKIPKSNTNEFQTRQIVNTKEGALPPNIAEEGEEQITLRNGRVYFGSSVATCLNSGITQSEFLTTVIRSQSNQ